MKNNDNLNPECADRVKQCLMISGGPIDREFVGNFIRNRKYDFIIAVDNGFSTCIELGIQPDLIVGDFDTFGRERIAAYTENEKFHVEIHRAEKDETDTELAFRDVIAAGCGEVTMFGAIGGRIDHEISGFHVLAQVRQKGVKVNLYDRRNKIFILDSKYESEHEFKKSEAFGTYVSFLPLTEKVNGITLTGFKYPLYKKDISILKNPSLCVSNEIVEESAWITFQEGILICVESRD